jgi:hypothetical protein
MAKVANKKANRISSNGSGKAPKVTSVVLKELNFPIIEITVKGGVATRGTSMLVQNCFGAKVRQQLVEAQVASDKPKKARHTARCPEEEVSEACHWMDPSQKPKFTFIEKENRWEFDEEEVAKVMTTAKFGVPLTAFKKAAVSACRCEKKFKMTEMRQALFVMGTDHPSLALIESKEPMLVNKSSVRLANNAPYERFRPSWLNWSCKFAVEYNSNFMSAADVVHQFSLAGKSVGVGEGRPEKGGDDWGRFIVASS